MTKHAFWRLFACGLLWASAAGARSQLYSFTTLAGSPGNIGTNDGLNLESRFHSPVGIAVDLAGTIYIADFLNHAIRQMTPSGTNWEVATIAGLAGSSGYADGTNSDARFNRPTGIAIDASGKLFVSERYNHTIRQIRHVGTNWVTSTVAGQATVMGHTDGTNTNARFYLPSGITIDNSNRLYVADTANFTIRELVQADTNWVVSTIAGSVTNYGFVDDTNLSALFDFPYDLKMSRAGKLYVADWGNNAIRQMSRYGTNWGVETIAGFSGAAGATDGPGSTARFYGPIGITVDNAENLYVADQSNNTIRKLTPEAADWTVTTLAGQPLRIGSTDGVSTNALFYKPWGITIDTRGNLFITDWGNNTIRMGIAPESAEPVLEVALFGDDVVLGWPLSASNYTLEVTTALDPGASWIPLTNGAMPLGDKLVLTNTLNVGQAFYRLRK